MVQRPLRQSGWNVLTFLGVCLTCSLFVWLFVPETKDKTLEEIGEFWLCQDGRDCGASN